MPIPISMPVIWGIAMVIFLIIEGVTPGLVSIWFAAGALCALLCSVFNGPLWLQILLFIVVSIAALILTRPLARKYINGKRQATNADRMIGMTGRVTERIDNIAATGAVQLGGKTWTARSGDGQPIDEGTLVQAEHIEGVKLIVRPAPAAEAGCSEMK